MVAQESLFPGGQHLGLRELRQPPNADVDILFIHGLRGHAYRTWVSETDVYWPLDLLAHDFLTARILSFGYDADVAIFAGNAGQGTLRDHAETLVGEFAARRGRRAAKRPVIIVAHSLGGLVAKKALCVSAESAEESAERALDRCLRGICFLGTPHRGSDLAKLGSIVANIASLFVSVNTRVVDVLKSHSEVLADLTSSFGNWTRRNSDRFNMVCFYEERECSPGGLIVPKAFATIDGYPQMQIPANHIHMCKFSSRYEAGYMRIQDHVRSWLGHDLDSDTDDEQDLEKMKSDLKEPLSTEAQAFMDSLFFPRIYRREDSISAPHADTFLWIESNSTYQEWKKSTKQIIWIKGHPGTGKSTLMKKILDMAKSDQALLKSTIILSHFFAQDSAPLQQSIEGLYRSLLVQLLQHPIKGLGTKIKRLLKRRGQSPGNNYWDVEDLEYFFHRMITDALDEFDVRQYIDDLHECRGDVDIVRRLVHSFYELGNKNHAKPHSISLAFSSRHYPRLIPVGAEKCICMENENDKDIHSVVESTLAHTGLDLPFKTWWEIRQLAGGNFRWLASTLDKVRESKLLGLSDEYIISRAKNDVPEHIERIYESALHSLPTRDHRAALRIFQLMCLCESRPRLSSIRSLLNVNESWTIPEIKNATGGASHISDDEQLDRMLPALSCGLLEIYQEADDYPRVRFIHYTVMKLMLKSGLLFLDEARPRSEEVTQKGRQRMYHLLALSAAVEMDKMESIFAAAAAKYSEDVCCQAIQYWSLDKKIGEMLAKNKESLESIVAIGDDELVAEFMQMKLKDASTPANTSDTAVDEDSDWTEVEPQIRQMDGRALTCLADIWPSLQHEQFLLGILALWLTSSKATLVTQRMLRMSRLASRASNL